MSTVNVNKRGQEFVDLHASGELIVLPTVWDAWSARLAEAAGFKGLTIGSHPVATAFGVADGEKQDLVEYMRQVERIAEAVNIPVSVDVEAGYGFSPDEIVGLAVEAGAVGLNVEDTVHHDDDRVRGLREHVDYIEAMVQAAAGLGVPFVVNGRTDALVHGTALYADPLAEAIARCQAMAEAGALSVYPVHLPDAASVKAVVDAVPIPVNVTAHPVNGTPAGGLEELRALGVRRVSFGPLWQAALDDTATSQLQAWRG
ncbi:MAG: isocitrate lyase/phosphoenolpyruvate mutase family protein [Arthrobacter sp.]|jgi:2-methylisocitrate lyase-like PEP mutase family enzyme|nr:isocitrate lyase/phosphoenolpyruvate mutase family protein [Arthrobacter sp.]